MVADRLRSDHRQPCPATTDARGKGKLALSHGQADLRRAEADSGLHTLERPGDALGGPARIARVLEAPVRPHDPEAPALSEEDAPGALLRHLASAMLAVGEDIIVAWQRARQALCIREPWWRYGSDGM